VGQRDIDRAGNRFVIEFDRRQRVNHQHPAMIQQRFDLRRGNLPIVGRRTGRRRQQQTGKPGEQDSGWMHGNPLRQ
jgi:hypothetical protein